MIPTVTSQMERGWNVLHTVLVVDDNFMIRTKLRQMFEESNPDWRVAEAVDGQDGVEKAASLKPDLVVLDLTMPVMNGLDAAAQIKSDDPRLPLILFTAHHNTVLDRQAFAKGISAVVHKDDAVPRLLDSASILVRYCSQTKLLMKEASC